MRMNKDWPLRGLDRLTDVGAGGRSGSSRFWPQKCHARISGVVANSLVLHHPGAPSLPLGQHAFELGRSGNREEGGSGRRLPGTSSSQRLLGVGGTNARVRADHRSPSPRLAAPISGAGDVLAGPGKPFGRRYARAGGLFVLGSGILFHVLFSIKSSACLLTYHLYEASGRADMRIGTIGMFTFRLSQANESRARLDKPTRTRPFGDSALAASLLSSRR